jgi:Fe-S-cluster containining protein
MNLNFINLLSQQDEFYNKLNYLRNEKRPAIITGDKKCIKCGFCCWQQPCDLNYEDIFIIAEHLKLSSKEFFNKYLTFQFFPLNKNEHYILTPIRKNQKGLAGKIKSMQNWFDLDEPCIFLENNECSLYCFRPTGAKIMNCWETPNVNSIAIIYAKKDVIKILNEMSVTK